MEKMNEEKMNEALNGQLISYCQIIVKVFYVKDQGR